VGWERGVNFVTDRKGEKKVEKKRGKRGRARASRAQQTRVTNEDLRQTSYAASSLIVICITTSVTLYSCWSNQPTNHLKEKGWMMPAYLRFFFFFFSFLPPFSFLVFPAESEEMESGGREKYW
jgi:hypothetical protein